MDGSSIRPRPVSMASVCNMADADEQRPGAAGAAGDGRRARRRTPAFLPTALEWRVALVYPALLTFGAVFAVVSPQTRAAAYDAYTQSHVQTGAGPPSYFARKDNLLNQLFVKRGWAWVTVAFAAFVLSHPATASVRSRVRAGLRWALVTVWWLLMTQWCFGPALIDRGFRFTGGRCEVAEEAVWQGRADKKELVTAVACKTSGGKWRGGHDISGHVFLLVLGSYFLIQEVGWVLVRSGVVGGKRDERTVVMDDGAVKGAGVEAQKGWEVSQGDRETEEVVVEEEQRTGRSDLGVGGKFAVTILGLCCWMLLMTAIYFHTWFEKFTGLLMALAGIYPVYILPRWVPALRRVVGLPGI